MKVRHVAIAATAAIATTVTLTACGKPQDKATMPVSAMVNNHKLRNDEFNWCGQQPNPEMIEGCVHADTADWFIRNPDKLALVKKLEPWPGKTTEFFQAARRARLLQASSLPMAEQNAMMAERNVQINARYVQQAPPNRFVMAELQANEVAAQENAKKAEANLAKIKTQIAAVPANEINAFGEEAAWCGAQSAWKSVDHATDFSQITPACGALQKVQIPRVNPF